jgi:hypothetical protein
MGYAEAHTVAITTAGGGTATGYTPVVSGRIAAVIYTKTDFANGVDFTITSEGTGQTIWTESDVNASKTVAPRQASHTTVGVAATYDGTRAALVPVVVANERVKIAIAQGGATKTGSFVVIVE